jgi:hypothetical protein
MMRTNGPGTATCRMPIPIMRHARTARRRRLRTSVGAMTEIRAWGAPGDSSIAVRPEGCPLASCAISPRSIAGSPMASSLASSRNAVSTLSNFTAAQARYAAETKQRSPPRVRSAHPPSWTRAIVHVGLRLRGSDVHAAHADGDPARNLRPRRLLELRRRRVIGFQRRWLVGGEWRGRWGCPWRRFVRPGLGCFDRMTPEAMRCAASAAVVRTRRCALSLECRQKLGSSSQPREGATPEQPDALCYIEGTPRCSWGGP